MRLASRCTLYPLLGLLASAGFAQSSNDANSTTIAAPPGIQSTDTRSDASRAATAGFKFDAPTPAPKKEKPKSADGDDDEADTDKPRNGIVRLPKYVVQGERPAVFSERTINTDKGMGEIAVKRYLSSVGQTLNMVHLPGILGGMSNQDIAMNMWREDQRLKNMNDLNSEADSFRKAGDPQSADQIKADTQDAYMRRSSFDSVPNSVLDRN